MQLRRGGNAIPLTPASRPAKGDKLELPASGRAGLALIPNALVALDRGCQLEIIDLVLTKDGNETGSAILNRRAAIRLSAGRLIATHGWGETTASFAVETPQGRVVTSSNALVCIEVREATTQLTCVSGWVEFQPAHGDGSTTRVAPGYVGEWSPEGAKMTAAETSPGPEDNVQDSLAMESNLQALLTQQRNVLPR